MSIENPKNQYERRIKDVLDKHKRPQSGVTSEKPDASKVPKSESEQQAPPTPPTQKLHLPKKMPVPWIERSLPDKEK